jgi:ribosomal protein L25 (general stress protein Ctc)
MDPITSATVVIAGFSVLTFFFVIRQTGLAAKAVNAAIADVAESRHARIDSRSPMVIVGAKTEPVIPACLKQSVITASRHSLTAEMRFDLPRDAHTKLLLTSYIQLHNEGVTSAFITLPPGSAWVPNPGERIQESNLLFMPWALGQNLNYRLGPNMSSWFLVEKGLEVEEWARLWHLFEGDIDRQISDPSEIPGVRIEISIKDQFASPAYLDTLIVDLLQLPIQPVLLAASSWELNQKPFNSLESHVRTSVVGLTRTYLSRTNS